MCHIYNIPSNTLRLLQYALCSSNNRWFIFYTDNTRPFTMTHSFTPNIAEGNEKVEQVLTSRKFVFSSCHISAMYRYIYNRKVFFLYEKPFALTFLLATFLFSSCHFICIAVSCQGIRMQPLRSYQLFINRREIWTITCVYIFSPHSYLQNFSFNVN